MSRNHSMLPPFMQPHPSEEEQLEQFNFLINKMASDARNNFFRFRLFNQDHQSRETSAVIDEYLYMQDHQRIQDEIKYNLAKDAVFLIFIRFLKTSSTKTPASIESKNNKSNLKKIFTGSNPKSFLS